jgi:plastocyanin
VSSFQFTPSRLEIEAGDRVIWRNAEGFHNVQADDGSFRCAEGCDREGGDGDPSAALWTVTRTFGSAGTVPYFCEVHGGPGGTGMAGVIVVRAGR